MSGAHVPPRAAQRDPNPILVWNGRVTRMRRSVGAVTIRAASPAERVALEALQRRASMHGPMYREQLAAHPDAITIPEDQIADGLVRVAEQNGRVVGFSVLLAPVAGTSELDGLFVEPDRMRTGVGRRLIADACAIARTRDATRIDVNANPQALAFYDSVGFVRVGEEQTRFGAAARMSLQLEAR